MNMNPDIFKKFLEVPGGIQWPHSPQLRRQIEFAGFVFRPKAIERDRCVCNTCGVEVSGWRLWHNPWTFHDWSKRHSITPPSAALSLLRPPTTAMDT